MGVRKLEARRVEKEWERAGVYYIRTEAMVLGFDLPLQGEFADDTVDSNYILVLDEHQKPVSTNRMHPIPEKGYVKIERVATISTARHLGAGRVGIEAETGELDSSFRMRSSFFRCSRYSRSVPSPWSFRYRSR